MFLQSRFLVRAGGCLWSQIYSAQHRAIHRLLLPTTTLLTQTQSQTGVRNMSSTKFQAAHRLDGTRVNVWVEFSKLANDNKAVNLGQGFPDFFPPQHIRDELAKAALSPNPAMCQYTRSQGHLRLVNILAKMYSRLLNHDVSGTENVLISVGAYGSLYTASQALINPGDEVIIIEPFFDAYAPMVAVAGGTPVFIPLRLKGEGKSSADYALDPDELASKFTNKTKLLFFNNPNNPLGKVYSREEMTVIADLCKKWDVVVLSDEVYEWLLYPGSEMIRMATLPGMWDRTVTIGSAGKTFSVTGWKTGWSIAPEHLLKCLQYSHQNCLYTCPTPLQEAVAAGLEREFPMIDDPSCYFNSLPVELKPKRDRMEEILSAAGMVPIVPDGGYFMMADISKLDANLDEIDTDDPKDVKFVKWMCINKKLSAIPVSVFYAKENAHLAQNLIRFCFCKEDSTIEKAADILKQWTS